MPVPKYDDLYNPLLKAMRNLGESASISEQEDEVTSILKLTEEEASEIHRENETKLTYRLAWARNYLKRFGLLENSSRGVWALTPKGSRIETVDRAEVNRHVKALDRKVPQEIAKDEEPPLPDEEMTSWQDRLIETLKSISPDSFEKLCQRLLRESGFTRVEVTGRSGDGGIDGKGVVKIGGLLSFHVVFQAKRYKGSVSASVVRDFRGAMVGRADKGLIISTGTFTKDARNEAQRPGAPPIDLMDGAALSEKLKDLRIGITVEEEVVEKVLVNEEWYRNL